MNTLFSLLFVVLQLFQFVLLARVLLSWFPTIDRSNPTVDAIIRAIYDITEPVLRPIRQMLPATAGLDWSPLIVFLGISVLMRMIMAF